MRLGGHAIALGAGGWDSRGAVLWRGFAFEMTSREYMECESRCPCAGRG